MTGNARVSGHLEPGGAAATLESIAPSSMAGKDYFTFLGFDRYQRLAQAIAASVCCSKFELVSAASASRVQMVVWFHNCNHRPRRRHRGQFRVLRARRNEPFARSE
jgi:hypothetical protein